jgi:regulator of protease activity HflC (stomatin/prohibitin superfamily)
MKSFIRGMLLCAVVFLAACSYVPPGNVGVLVNAVGQQKGVDAQILPVGRYWLTWNETLYLFPTFTQNYVWDKARTSQSPNDESISFQTEEGLSVNADIGISYHIDPNKVSMVFQKYRRGVEEITDTFLRNMVRDSLVKEASSLPIEAVYGKGKSELIDHVQADVAKQVADIGIQVEKIYWIGDLRLPENVTHSINAKIQATQMAQQRENEVAQATAEANKVIAVAKGNAEATRIAAEADAKAFQIKGAALAANPLLIQELAIERWNGTLPAITGGVTPFIQTDGKGSLK